MNHEEADVGEEPDKKEAGGADRVEGNGAPTAPRESQPGLLICLCEESGALLCHDQFKVAFARGPVREGHA